MKTSTKRISVLAFVALMFLVNLSCTKDIITPNLKTTPMGPSSSVWKVTPANNDSVTLKNVATSNPLN
ncbi:MAG: hypothetical protein WCO54_11575 [Bacteroidota bacterium]